MKEKLKLWSGIILTSILLSTISCCKDGSVWPLCGPTEESDLNLDELGLPPATTTGENTLGCLIDGEPWIPLSRADGGGLSYNLSWSVSSSDFSINTFRNIDEHASFLSMSEIEESSDGVFVLSMSWADDSDSCDTFSDTQSDFNRLFIDRLDNDNEIFSGRFQCEVVVGECDTVLITEGRFDFSN